MLNNVSIIIPLAPNEARPDSLLKILETTAAEIILGSEGTRAKSLNKGAAKAQHKFLWFLHADSQVTSENLSTLQRAVIEKPNALHYFDLAFDGGSFMKINALGANLRSRIFGTPFGDQAFCISKTLFAKTNGYPEDVKIAEDLSFVWRTRHAGIPLNRLPSTLITSARKYRARGWLKLTAYYQWIWITKSIPQAIKLWTKK